MTIGSYICDCQIGYSGDGDKCEDVDECRGDVNGDVVHCHANAECIAGLSMEYDKIHLKEAIVT